MLGESLNFFMEKRIMSLANQCDLLVGDAAMNCVYDWMRRLCASSYVISIFIFICVH